MHLRSLPGVCKYGRAGASQQTSSWRLGYPCSSAAERPISLSLVVRVTSVENLEVEETAANHRDHRRVVMEVVDGPHDAMSSLFTTEIVLCVQGGLILNEPINELLSRQQESICDRS